MPLSEARRPEHPFQQQCNNFKVMSHKNFETPFTNPLTGPSELEETIWHTSRGFTESQMQHPALFASSWMVAERNLIQDEYICLKLLWGKAIPLQSYAVILFGYTYTQNIPIILGCTHRVSPSSDPKLTPCRSENEHCSAMLSIQPLFLSSLMI